MSRRRLGALSRNRSVLIHRCVAMREEGNRVHAANLRLRSEERRTGDEISGLPPRVQGVYAA